MKFFPPPFYAISCCFVLFGQNGRFFSPPLGITELCHGREVVGLRVLDRYSI